MYHPKSGPLEYSAAQELEDALGEELRSKYAGLGRKPLVTALGKRRKPVRVSEKVARTWLEQFACPEPSAKRARGAGAAASASSSARSAADAAPPAEPQVLLGVDAVEEACGPRFRAEVCDLGLDSGKREMVKTLLSWGYRATQEACRNWLEKHRLGTFAGVDGGVSTYTLYRQHLLRWHFVDELSPLDVQQRLLSRHGVWAHRGNLQQWLKAPGQQLPALENNQDIHAHPCGEYVLEQLQTGVRPADVVRALLEEYLV